MFNDSCPIVNGNPSNTEVVWRRSSDTKTWTSTELFLPNISRHDDSIYTCYAGNVMTDSNGTTKYGNSSGYITLVVQCIPRANMNVDVQFNTISATSQTVTLSYAALAYPPPSFVWHRLRSSINTSDPRINVSSSNQQTNLTITNVEERDFGEYTLTVTNDVGSIKELFHLKPYEPTAHDSTSQNVSAIVGGAVSGLVVLCVIVLSVFIYRRRIVNGSKVNKQTECSTIQSPVPATYENLRIDQIPSEFLNYQRGAAYNRTSETNVGTENDYTQLGNDNNDDPPVIHQMQDVIVIEGELVTLHCYVTRANPPVYSMRWTSNKYNVSNAIFSLTNVSRSDDMMYTCIAKNSMEQSCQDIVQGSTSKSIHMEVLYSPFVNITQGKTFTVKEGDTFNYTCLVLPGNPASTNITWRRSSGTKTWSSAQLLIINVTKYDDSLYTCYASNWMVTPTGTTKSGNVSKDIRLNVQFKTTVTDFYIRGYGHNINVIVMETTHLIFTCRLQSNHIADVRIVESETVVNSCNANELLYNTKASCSDGPVYFGCHGNNSLNYTPSTRQIQLFVRCKPRLDMNSNVQFVVTSAINQTATMSYTVLAYPYPSFIWYRNGSSTNTRGSRINIFSTDMQTYLIINHVGEKDFGEYTLTVTNDLGSVNELFLFKPQESTVQPCNSTSQNVSAIIGGTLGGLVVLCGMIFSVFIYRRRCFHSPLKNEQQECSTVQSPIPVTYKNLKINEIPNDPLEVHIETASSHTSETNLDHTYEGLSRENNGKETEYTSLGDSIIDGE